MDYILRLDYPGGRANIDMRQLFPTNGDKRKKLLALIRENCGGPYDSIDQIKEYLDQAIDRMEAEEGSAEERYKEYKKTAKDIAVYKGVLSAAQREVTVFRNAKDKLSKEKQWWERLG